MAKVHRSAVIEGDVRLAEDVTVGPNCVLDGTLGPLVVGAGCVLVAGAFLNGPLTMGERNVVYPGACLGFSPQDLGFDPNRPGAGAVIGSSNIFREGFTLHRGKTTDPTRIGNHNFFMTNSHVGHDSVVDNHCILASGALLGGHVHLADRVILGGSALVHQFCRLGKGCMFSGGVGVSMDVPMWFTVTSINLAGSLNIVGMRRNGLTQHQIHTVRWVYRVLYRSGGTPQQAIPQLQARADDPLVREYLEFIQSSKRGICHGVSRATRGGTGGVHGPRTVPGSPHAFPVDVDLKP